MKSILFNIPSPIHHLPQDPVIRMFQRRHKPHPTFGFLSFFFPFLIIPDHTEFMRAMFYFKSGKIPDFNPLFSSAEILFSSLVPLEHTFRILKQKPSFVFQTDYRFQTAFLQSIDKRGIQVQGICYNHIREMTMSFLQTPDESLCTRQFPFILSGSSTGFSISCPKITCGGLPTVIHTTLR